MSLKSTSRSSSMSSAKYSALFVCLGNICRSPIAEAIFIELLEKRGKLDEWEVASAAIIGFHTGNPPDRRARTVLKAKGHDRYEHSARPVTTDDFRHFTYIFGMDNENLRDLKETQKMVTDNVSTLKLLGEYDPQGVIEVPDPYYESGDELFYQVYDHCHRACNAFLDQFYKDK